MRLLTHSCGYHSPMTKQAKKKAEEVICYLTTILSSISIGTFKKKMQSDATLLWVTVAVKPEWSPESDKGVLLVLFYKLRDGLTVVESMLVGSDVLVPPATLMLRIIALAHEAHLGIVPTKQRLCERFWWSKMWSLPSRIVTSANKPTRQWSLAQHPCNQFPFHLDRGNRLAPILWGQSTVFHWIAAFQ